MKMTILKYAFIFTLTIVTGASLMVVSHKVRQAEVKISRIDRSVEQEREAIRNLKAEWAYLNDPARLETLASQYLDLVPPVSTDLLSGFEQVPVALPEEVSVPSVETREAAIEVAPLHVTEISYVQGGVRQ